MTWLVHSLGNGCCWAGPVDLYIKIEDILSRHNTSLSYLSWHRPFYGYFIPGPAYEQEASRTIEMILSNGEADETTTADLLVLQEVYRGGAVVMG